VRKTITPRCKLWPWKQQLYERFTSMSFQMVWVVPKFYMILFYMLGTFYLSSFFPRCYFNKVCFELPQNVTWTLASPGILFQLVLEKPYNIILFFLNVYHQNPWDGYYFHQQNNEWTMRQWMKTKTFGFVFCFLTFIRGKLLKEELTVSCISVSWFLPGHRSRS